MTIQRKPILGLTQDAPVSKKTAGSLRLAPTIKNDVFLKALLETPTTKHARRSPLEWLGAMGFHVLIIATLIIVPLYTTATIHLNEYQDIALVAPPPPPAPQRPTGAALAQRVMHTPARMTYTLQKLTAPKAIPKTISQENGEAPLPDLSAVAGGVPGGVTGGQIGGMIGGVIGGTGTTAPAPPKSRPVQKKVVRVGSNLKAPRQTYSVNPVYPPLAREAHISGTVVVEAVIDEHGNVVQARVVSGHPLLIDAALKAVLQWRYEPTTLDGQPVRSSCECRCTSTYFAMREESEANSAAIKLGIPRSTLDRKIQHLKIKKRQFLPEP